MSDWSTLIGAFVGALFGAGITAWIQGYFGERSRIAAVKMALSDVLNQAEQKAHAEEKGKLLAAQEDLNRMVERLSAATSAVEGIKGQVLQDLWDIQTTWSFKRDVYVRLLECLGDKQIFLHQAAITLPPDVIKRSLELDHDIQRVSSIAALALNLRAMLALDAMKKGIDGLDKAATRAYLLAQADVIRKTMDEISSAAREDLGIKW